MRVCVCVRVLTAASSFFKYGLKQQEKAEGWSSVVVVPNRNIDLSRKRGQSSSSKQKSHASGTRLPTVTHCGARAEAGAATVPSSCSGSFPPPPPSSRLGAGTGMQSHRRRRRCTGRTVSPAVGPLQPLPRSSWHGDVNRSRVAVEKGPSGPVPGVKGHGR